MAKIPKDQRCQAILTGTLDRCSEPATEIVPDPFLEYVYLCKGHKEEFSRFETAIMMSTRNKGGDLD